MAAPPPPLGRAHDAIRPAPAAAQGWLHPALVKPRQGGPRQCKGAKTGKNFGAHELIESQVVDGHLPVAVKSSGGRIQRQHRQGEGMVDPGANGTNALAPIMTLELLPLIRWALLRGGLLWPGGRRGRLGVLPILLLPGAFSPPRPGHQPPWRSFPHLLGTVSHLRPARLPSLWRLRRTQAVCGQRADLQPAGAVLSGWHLLALQALMYGLLP